MKSPLLVLLMLVLALSCFAQDHILIDAVHGANYFSSPDGPRNIDFQAIFPNDIITVANPDSLAGMTYLIDTTYLVQEGNLTFTIDLPESAPADCIQTLYVNLDNYHDFFSFVSGTITNPNGDLVQNLYAGNGHADNAYGAGWVVQIQFAIETWGESQHIRIGYGNTLFSSSAHTGLYDPANYDAILSFYNNYYFAFLEDAPDYSETDTQALTEAFQNGLSMMLAYNYATAIPAKPFIHMYTKDDMNASVQVTVPGKRSFALPKPEGNEKTFGWKNIQLKPNSENEHLWECASNQRFNFIDFNLTGTNIHFRNQTDTPLYDLILVKNIDHQHFKIGIKDNLKPGIDSQVKEWKSLTTTQAKDFLKEELYKQCLEAGLTEKEAHQFSYGLPWVDILILRAMLHSDQYFGFYHFDNAIFDRLIPLDIKPTPSAKERNLWVLLSNIQPRQSEPALTLNSLLDNEKQVNGSEDFIYREYGMVDEHYSMSRSQRNMEFFGFDIDAESVYGFPPFAAYDNPMGNELAEFTSVVGQTDGSLKFIVDNPSQTGIFSCENDPFHPIIFGKRFLNNGRLMVLGDTEQFLSNSGYPFVNAAMNSLIHSPNLGTQNASPLIPMREKVQIFNYPNPFNPETTIKFSIPEKGKVEIELYNIKGQLIKRIIFLNMERGLHSIQWNGLNQNHEQVASQIVLCRMRYEGREYIRKMVLVK